MPRWRGIGVWRMVPCMEVYELSQLEAQYQDEICWIHTWRLFPSGCTCIWMGPAVILMQDSKFFLCYFFATKQVKLTEREKCIWSSILRISWQILPKLMATLRPPLLDVFLYTELATLSTSCLFFLFYLRKHDWNIMCSWSCLLCYPFQLLVWCLISMGIFCSVSTRIWCDLSATGLGAVWALSVACREDYRLSRSSEAGSGSRPWVPKRDIPLAGGDCW